VFKIDLLFDGVQKSEVARQVRRNPLSFPYGDRFNARETKLAKNQ
jgi:hypothetical protein